MNNLYLLILGSPRSGTTLLAAMLGCHSQIAVLNENHDGSVQRILSKPVRGVKLCMPNQIELNRRSTAITSLLLSLSRRLGIRSRIRWPSSRFSIRDYQQRLSNLRIIVIVRDSRDVIKSIRKRGNQSAEVAAYRWTRAIEILSTLHQEASEQVIIVQYEQLVTAPREVMKKILHELGSDFEETVLEGYRHTPQYAGNESIRVDKVRQANCKNPLRLADTPLLDSRPELQQSFKTMLETAL